MTTEPARGEAGPPPGQTPPGVPPGSPFPPSPPADDAYQQAGQPPQPYVQPSQPYPSQAEQPAQPYAQPGQPGQPQYAPQPGQPGQPGQPYAQPGQPGQQPYAPQPGQPYAQPGQPTDRPYDYQPPPQPGYLQGGPSQQAPYPPQQQFPPQPAPSPYEQPLPPPPAQPDRLRSDPSRHASFDGPLPDAPADNPPLQWGTPLSAAAPAPKPPGRPPLSTLAVVSLVAGGLTGVPALVVVLFKLDLSTTVLLSTLGGLGGLALVLGLISLVRCRGGRRRGAGLAVTGIVLAAVWGAGAAAVVVLSNKPEARDASGKVVREGDVPVTSLKVGECIKKWAVAGTVGDVTVLPCTMNHDAEVFHTFTATGTDKFPGDAAIVGEAATQCLEKAKTALKPDDLKKAKTAYFKPVEAGWGNKQRQIACVAVMPAALGRSIRK